VLELSSVVNQLQRLCQFKAILPPLYGSRLVILSEKGLWRRLQ